MKAHNETRVQNCHWPRQGARVFLAGGTNFFVKIIQHRNASGTQKYRVPSPSSAKSTHDENRAQLCSRGNRIAATYLASRQIILDIFQSCCKAVAKNLYYFIYSFFFFFFLLRNIIDFVLHSTYMSIVVEFEGYPSL